MPAAAAPRRARSAARETRATKPIASPATKKRRGARSGKSDQQPLQTAKQRSAAGRAADRPPDLGQPLVARQGRPRSARSQPACQGHHVQDVVARRRPCMQRRTAGAAAAAALRRQLARWGNAVLGDDGPAGRLTVQHRATGRTAGTGRGRRGVVPAARKQPRNGGGRTTAEPLRAARQHNQQPDERAWHGGTGKRDQVEARCSFSTICPRRDRENPDFRLPRSAVAGPEDPSQGRGERDFAAADRGRTARRRLRGGWPRSRSSRRQVAARWRRPCEGRSPGRCRRRRFLGRPPTRCRGIATTASRGPQPSNRRRSNDAAAPGAIHSARSFSSRNAIAAGCTASTPRLLVTNRWHSCPARSDFSLSFRPNMG